MNNVWDGNSRVEGINNLVGLRSMLVTAFSGKYGALEGKKGSDVDPSCDAGAALLCCEIR